VTVELPPHAVKIPTSRRQVVAGLAGEFPGPPPTQHVIESPRSLNPRSAEDLFAFGGAIVASFALDWLLYENVFPAAGKVGFVVSWYLLFIGMYGVIVRLGHPAPVVKDKIVAALVSGGAVIVAGALTWTIVFVLTKGWPALHHPNFYTQTQSTTGPTSPLSQGGILNDIVGSLIEVGIAVAFAVPAGIGAAIYMTEVGGRLSRIVRTVVEAMTALPDLVAGLFIYYFLIVLLAHIRWASQSFATKNGLAAALAIGITMLPIVARSSEVVLRVVPGGLREAGLALGSSQWSTVWRVVLPTARAGLATAVILGIARGIGETAPVLIVSAPSTFMQVSPVGNPMNSMPLAAYTAIRNGINPQTISRGFGAAAVLLVVVMILFAVIRLLARQRTGR
jgi:phosphate transport system permease protein